jgi:hypothetical protein
MDFAGFKYEGNRGAGNFWLSAPRAIENVAQNIDDQITAANPRFITVPLNLELLNVEP